METKRAGPSAYKRHAAAINEVAIAKKKVKTISVTSMFKQPHQKTKNSDIVPQINVIAPTSTTGDVSIAKGNTSKSLSSSHSPYKSSANVLKKHQDIHPLLTAFKEESKTYRSKVYINAAETVNENLNALLGRLHDSTTKTVRSNDASDPQVSQIELSAPAKYDYMSQTIFYPLSESTARCSGTRKRGEEQSDGATIHERFYDFDEQIRTQTDEIKKLQSRWEAIVREIFKLGVSCLGEDAMKTMLLPTPAAQTAQDQPSSPPSDRDSESALFVSEMTTADKGKGKKKKKVSFEPPESAVTLPEFLYQPSMFTKKIVPDVPRLSGTKVAKLQADVGQLGNKHVNELRELEREYVAWWQKKTELIAEALVED